MANNNRTVTTCVVCEFESVGWASGRSLDTLRARVVSLRDLSQGGNKADADVMPFELDQFNEWRASRWIGTFQHEGYIYKITPRIGDKLFSRIAIEAISAALLPEGKSPNRSKLNGLNDLLPLIWFLALRRARSQHGVPRLYVKRSKIDRLSLRGRLDLPRQLTENRFAQHQLACIWSELTFDNPLTRTILMTIDYLDRTRSFPFGGQDGDIARELREIRTELQVALHGVWSHANLPQEAITWSRANDRYRAVYDIGRAMLYRRGAEENPAVGAAVLLDSAEIWELFLFRKLQAVIRKNFPQLRIDWPRERRAGARVLLEWEGRPARALIPDIVIKEGEGGRRTAILDAKYRTFAAPYADHSVADQMALYAMTIDAAVDAPSATEAITPPVMLLVYPQADTASGVKGLNIALKDKKIIGEGRFLFHEGRVARLIAWCVPLPEVEATFDSIISENLCALLRTAFPPL